MAIRHKCFNCGFETNDKGKFLGNQGDGDHFWTIFICPQCARSNPPVAEVGWGDPVPFKEPVWKVVETNEGLYIYVHHDKGGQSGAPMQKDHQLVGAPASRLRKGLEGTMWEHSQRLKARGDERSKAFHKSLNEWTEANPYPRINTQEAVDRQAKYRKVSDAWRQEFKVGPHDDRVEHDGPALQRRARV